MPKIPVTLPADTPADFEAIVKKAQFSIESLKKLDYEKLYAEMSGLNVPTTESAVFQVLAEQITKVQSAKDRMSEILVDVEREFRVKKRCADLLVEGWQKFSSESSSDKRKADAVLRMAEFSESASDAECLHRTAMRIMINLDDKQGSISRQVTVYQLLQKMHDINRGTSDPDLSPGWNHDDPDKDLKDWDKQPQ